MHSRGKAKYEYLRMGDGHSVRMGSSRASDWNLHRASPLAVSAKKAMARGHGIQEWREVITTLQKSMTMIVQFDAARNLSTVEEKKAAMPAVLDARAVAFSVLSNRLFITKEVRHHKMFDKWKKAVEEFDGDHDPGKFGTLFGELRHLIEVEARAEISKL